MQKGSISRREAFPSMEVPIILIHDRRSLAGNIPRQLSPGAMAAPHGRVRASGTLSFRTIARSARSREHRCLAPFAWAACGFLSASSFPPCAVGPRNSTMAFARATCAFSATCRQFFSLRWPTWERAACVTGTLRAGARLSSMALILIRHAPAHIACTRAIVAKRLSVSPESFRALQQPHHRPSPRCARSTAKAPLRQSTSPRSPPRRSSSSSTCSGTYVSSCAHEASNAAACFGV